MKHLLLSLSLVCILCSGCATIQTQLNAKNSLLAPASLDSPQAKQYIEDAYAVSLISAQNSTNPADITRYVSAGNAVNAMHCGDWLDLISTNKRKQVIGADNAGVLENLITAALGLAKASSTLVAGYGIAATAYSGFNNVVNKSRQLCLLFKRVVLPNFLFLLQICLLQKHIMDLRFVLRPAPLKPRRGRQV